MKRLTVNLDLPPEERWSFLSKYKQDIDELIAYYLNDLIDVGFFEGIIDSYKNNFIKPSYIKELDSIASISEFSTNQILIANLYYDALKLVFGCTSFAIEGSEAPYHARNLDWWSKNDDLRTKTKIFDFVKNGEVLFSGIGWAGFIGVFSGIKNGAYSVTLNAVSSNEPPNLAPPVTFLLRDVLEEEKQFDKAGQRLSETAIASDCLLMLVGTNKEELIVIERTPTKHEIRKPENGVIVATNDYKILKDEKLGNDILQETSCGRYNRVLELVSQSPPKTANDYLDILQDDKVKMNITMQQMVLNPSEGTILLY